jgi:hypothetical protein
MTQNACVQLVTQGISNPAGLSSVLVNGAALPLPADIASANGTAACGASKTANTIEWIYRLKDNAS